MTWRHRILRLFVVSWALGGFQWGCMGDDASGMMNNNGPDASHCLGGELRFEPVSPGEGDMIRARLVPAGQETILSVSWNVSGPGGPVAFDPREENRAVEFKALVAGGYSVEADLQTDRGTCSVIGSLSVHSAEAKSAMYRFLFTPSDPGSFPRQEKVVKIYEDSPVSGQSFPMDEGSEVTLAARGPNGPLSAYLRLVPRSGGLLLLDGFYDTSAPLVYHLDSNAAYDVSVIPESAAVAPMKFDALSTVELAGGAPYQFILDSGRALVGDVLDSSQQGLLDADVSLACGDHPPALSSTDLSGHFALAVRPGACSLAVRPAPETGLPSAELDVSQGLSLPASGNLDVTVRFAEVPMGSLDLQVLYPDGQAASGANVLFVSRDASAVAQVTASLDGIEQGNWSASGHWQTDAVTDAEGRLSLFSVPAGRLSVLVEPERRVFAGRFDVDVTPSETTSAVLSLSDPVVVQGRVFDPGDPSRDMSLVRVGAVIREGTGATFSGYCAADGTFSLEVPSGLTLDLMVVPERRTGLVRRLFADLVFQESGAVPGQESGIALEQGLPVTGTVEAVNAGGTLVQVFCTNCDNPEPWDEAVVDSTGAFFVLVPNPR